MTVVRAAITQTTWTGAVRAAAERFAATAVEAGTAVRVAERVRGRDSAVALRILAALLAREDLTDREAGFRAAVLAGEIDPLAAIPALERFAALTRVPGGLRVMAGKRILETHGGSMDTLVRLAADAGLEDGDVITAVDGDRVAQAASGRNGGFFLYSLTHGIGHGKSRFAAGMAAFERLGIENFEGAVAPHSAQGIDWHTRRGGGTPAAQPSAQPGFNF